MAERKQTILIVDDEAPQRRLLAGFVASLGYQVAEAESAEQMLEQVAVTPPDMILLDVRLPGMSGLEALHQLRKAGSETPVLLITAYADLREAVAAVKSGADDYLAKPLDFEELEAVITDALHPDHRPAPSGRELPQLPPEVIGTGASFQHLLETVSIVAPTEVPVLIIGESGTGKEVVAQLIHRWSPRAEKPFVVANCAGLPETLIESELFGHVKGAFTGAQQSRQGYFRAADGGTLLLDEIGELPLHLQPKLLRVLETGQVMPVGSDHPVPVDVRIIAATHRDVSAAVDQGTFRLDLYYRLNVVELRLPPLRERVEDILPLARHFAQQLTGHPVRFSPQATQCLLAYSWPGNVRELRNAVHRACLLGRGDVILPEHFPPAIAMLAQAASSNRATAGRLSQVERATILATLAECRGNRTAAARKLGLSRRALIYKLREIERENADGGNSAQ